MKRMTKLHLPRIAWATGGAFLLFAAVSIQSASAQTNTKTGVNAGIGVTSGVDNTSDGASALQLTTTGSSNTAIGESALHSNVSGAQNVAVGALSLQVSTASFNTAIGYASMLRTVAGNLNTAVGNSSLINNYSGSSNVSIGYQALFYNISGGFNTAIGDGALLHVTATDNIGLGQDAGFNLTSGSHDICIGNKGVAGESGMIRIGTAGTQTDTFLTGVIHGNGAGLTGVPAASLTGTVATAQLGAGVVNSSKLASSLTLAGTTSGTFKGPLTGNASTATTATTATNATTAASFTGALGGDVTGAQSATKVALVGGVTAAKVASGANLANSATAQAVPNTVVLRDSTGTFGCANIEALNIYTGAIAPIATSISFGGVQITPANGFLSLGSVTPVAKLDVSGSGWFRADSGSLPTSSTQGVRVFYDSQNKVGQMFTYDYTAGAPLSLALQQPGGNVGIGAASQIAQTRLDVAGSGWFRSDPNSVLPAAAGQGVRAFYDSANGCGSLYAYDFGASKALPLCLEERGGKVGIGIAAPTDALDVNGGGWFRAESSGLPTSAAQGVRVFYDATDKIGQIFTYDYTAGAPLSLALQQPGGNVGIGAASQIAQTRLDVAGSGWFRSDSNSVLPAAAGQGVRAFYDSGNKCGSLYAFDYGASNALPLCLEEQGGNVGIGIAAPADALDVNGGGWFRTYTQTFPSSAGSGVRVGYDGVNGIGSVYSYNYTTSVAQNLALNQYGGNVGIGTTSSFYAPLTVLGTPEAYAGGNQGGYGDFNGFAAGRQTLPPASVSIYSDQFVEASGYLALSDARIKRIDGHSDAACDLSVLRGIEVTDYHYIDTLAKGTNPQKKVIAQQVEKVYPQAVSQGTNVVPDIYQNAAIKDGWVSLATDLKAGDRVRLIAGREQAVYEVLEATEAGFRTGFQPKADKVFVYGREVNDFRTVDYEAISMLNVSATQELARKLESKDAEIAALKKQLEEKENALEARIAAIEKAEARVVKGEPAERAKAQLISLHP